MKLGTPRTDRLATVAWEGLVSVPFKVCSLMTVSRLGPLRSFRDAVLHLPLTLLTRAPQAPGPGKGFRCSAPGVPTLLPLRLGARSFFVVGLPCAL